MQRLSTIPGIDALTIASQPPAGGAAPKTLKIQGRDMTDRNNRLPVVDRVAIVPGYFRALEVGVIGGRDFTTSDGAPGSEVAIVNPPFVTRYFPNDDPLGKRIRLGSDLDRGTEDTTAPWVTIVGVSPAIFQRSQRNELTAQPTVY